MSAAPSAGRKPRDLDQQLVADVVDHWARPVVLVGHSYGGAVITDGAADDEVIAGLDAIEPEGRFCRAHADAGGGQVEPAALPAAHDLGVAGQDADAGFGAAAGD